MTDAMLAGDDVCVGPLLRRLLDAQLRDGRGASQVALRRAAKALAVYVRALGFPSLVPVSAAGHRLAGAAILIDGDVHVQPGYLPAAGASILVVEGAAVTGAALLATALELRRAGVASVYGFASELPSAVVPAGILDGLRVLDTVPREEP